MEKKFKDRLEKIVDKALDGIENHPVKSVAIALLTVWVSKGIFGKGK